MSDHARQSQSRTIDHPTVSVHQSSGDQHAILMFDLPAHAPGADLGSVFVRLNTSEIADLRKKLYFLGLRR